METDSTDAEVIVEKAINGTLLQQIDDSITFVNQAVALTDGIHRSELFEYPISALLKAIVNAVCHRDYTITGSAIWMNVFTNRIEIRSPVRLPNTLTVQSIRYRQFTRNQTIASFLSGAGYMVQRGKGILRLEKACVEAGISCITLTHDEGEFIVSMFRGGATGNLEFGMKNSELFPNSPLPY